MLRRTVIWCDVPDRLTRPADVMVGQVGSAQRKTVFIPDREALWAPRLILSPE
jgi:hypothetical protein